MGFNSVFKGLNHIYAQETAAWTYIIKNTIFFFSSSSDIVKRVVPRGWVLGSLPLNIYINDFPLQVAEVITLADDTRILVSHTNYNNFLTV